MPGFIITAAARALAKHNRGISLPDKSASVVYQSGQTVPVTGQYELVGAKGKSEGTSDDSIIHELKADELFPDHEGRSVAWHSVKSES